MKYNLGTTQIQDGTGTWRYPKGMWIQNAAGTWTPIKTGWICKSDGTWERIYPTPRGNLIASVSGVSHTTYQNQFDQVQTIKFTNIGDYDAVITSLAITDQYGYSTTVTSGISTPQTISPGNAVNLSFNVFGSNIGNFSGNIILTSNIGYLGNATLAIPVSTTVLQDFSAISVSSALSLTFNLNQYQYTNKYTSSTVANPYVVPVGVTQVGVELIGGGGGGGGTDRLGGAAGYGGQHLTGIMNVSTGDTLAFHTGGGGAKGINQTAGTFATGGYSDVGFSGGTGGPAGYSPSSGAGGAGGAATVLYYNSSLYAVAAGGGGGGGGGDYGYGIGQAAQAPNGVSTAGQAGGNRGGSDGGGPGGGGGGNPGGASGAIVGGDRGSYSGSNGYNLVPSGWSAAPYSNGGYANSGPGGDGSILLTEYSLANAAAQYVTIQNSGVGADLNISSVTSTNGYLSFANVPSVIGYDFNTYTGNSATFTVIPHTLAFTGTYRDTIVISSDAKNGTISIPVTIVISS